LRCAQAISVRIAFCSTSVVACCANTNRGQEHRTLFASWTFPRFSQGDFEIMSLAPVDTSLRPRKVRFLRSSPRKERKRWVLPLAAHGILIARYCEGDPQMLLVPTPQYFRIVSSEERSSNTRHFSIFVPPAIPSRTVAPAGGGETFGCMAVCAAMPSWFRLRMKLNPKANDRVRSSWRL
jgi:hypothetical protein